MKYWSWIVLLSLSLLGCADDDHKPVGTTDYYSPTHLGPLWGTDMTQTEKSQESYPTAIKIKGKPGFVLSPYAPNEAPVDVRGFSHGNLARCPYTDKIFIVP